MGGFRRAASAPPSARPGRPARPRGPWPILAGLVLLALLAGLAGCQSYQGEAEDRLRHAMSGEGPVVVAVVSSSSVPNLISQGAQLAARWINDRGGVLGGRRLELIHLDDEGRLPVGEKIARRLAGNKEVVAVVGHLYSEVAVPVSIIYGASGLLFISTGATDPQFSLIPNPYSLRVVPNDGVTALAMAELAHKLGLNNLVVTFQRGLNSTFYGRSLANSFSAVAVDQGLNILHVRSFFPWQEDLRPMLAPMRHEKLDGLVAIGFLPQLGELISQARSLSMRATILGSDSLDDPDLLTLPNRAAEGVIVASFFRDDLTRPATRDFVTGFRKAFAKTPDDHAAAAFDAVMLIAAACQKAGSSVPLDLANALTYHENFPGASSVYNFSPDGDPTGRWIWFKEVKDGKFVYLPNEYQPQNPAHLDGVASPKSVDPAE